MARSGIKGYSILLAGGKEIPADNAEEKNTR